MSESTFFAKNLIRHRTNRSMTRKQLAAEINVTESIVRYWEMSNGTASTVHLVALADFFEITIDELIRENVMKIISWNIQHLRNKKKISQEWMANELDITRSRLSSWEEHRAEPPIDMIIKLSEYFAVTIDELIKTDLRRCI